MNNQGYTARGHNLQFSHDITLTRSASEATVCVPRLRFGLVFVLPASSVDLGTDANEMATPSNQYTTSIAQKYYT